MSVRQDLVHLGMGYGNVPFELGQLLITRQIIANGMEIDFSMLGSLRIFDKGPSEQMPFSAAFARIE